MTTKQKKAHIKEYRREYRQRPEAKEKEKAYRTEYLKRPEVKARRKAYQRRYWVGYRKIYTEGYLQRPEVKQMKKEYMREYYQRPGIKEHYSEYNARPEVRKRHNEYNARPEVRKRHNEYTKEHSSWNRLIDEYTGLLMLDHPTIKQIHRLASIGEFLERDNEDWRTGIVKKIFGELEDWSMRFNNPIQQ